MLFLLKMTTTRLFRIIKDRRYILLVVVPMVMIFTLIQSTLHRQTLHANRKSHLLIRTGEQFNEDSRRFMNEGENKFLWQIKSLLANSNQTEYHTDDNHKRSKPVVDVQISGDGDKINKNTNHTNDVDNLTGEDEGEEMIRLLDSPYIYHEEKEKKRLNSSIIEERIKRIAFYHPYDRSHKSYYPCRYKKCEHTHDMTRADVVAFRAALVRDHGLPVFQRPPSQRWVVFTSDPATKHYRLGRPDVRSKFNATCTYRQDADIQYTFGKLRKVKPPSLDYDKIFDSKQGTAAWLVSNCHTTGGREDYVRRMQTVFDIDVFGKCSNRSCGNGKFKHNDGSCLQTLSRYKFYLSFESSFCEDYVTEKFFKIFIPRVHAIPVARGGVDYNSLFPSGVFVNAADFDTPEQLAKYLVDLGNDKERYLQMLRKKSSWGFVWSGEALDCRLCEYAHTQTTPKFYPNIEQAFNGNFPHCWTPRK